MPATALAARPDHRARLFFVAWLAVALVAGATGMVDRLRPPAPQFAVLLLTVGVIVLERRAGWLREAVARASLRNLVALHVSRLVGIEFLVATSTGVLPRAFAFPAGVGDILVAVLALGLVSVARPATARARGYYMAWNVIGLLDLVFVVANAARLAFANPASMDAMLRLPLSLLPTFLVPVLLATHVWIFRRLAAAPAAAP